MAQRLLQSKYGLNEPAIQRHVVFVCDCSYDESMFAYLTHTFGVANISRWLDRMTHHPRYLLAQRGGIGFTELATLLGNLCITELENQFPTPVRRKTDFSDISPV
ncbi:MAG: hypothetical protein ACQEW0_17360 [Pseudomonadota bacterium]